MVKYSKKQNQFYDQMFGALSDETRREILDRVSKAKRLTITEIAQPYIKEKTMSLPAISKHIKILGKSNLIKIKTVGRVRIVTSNKEAARYLGKFFDFYNRQLDNAEDYLKKSTKKTSKK